MLSIWISQIKILLFGKELFFHPFPNGKLLTVKLKEFADDSFKLDENGRKFSKLLENTLEKRRNYL